MKRVVGAIALAAIAAGARSQAVSDPNQVVGTVRYTNRDRGVLAVLDDRPITRGRVDATSVSPSGFAHWSSLVVTGARSGTYEVTVESSASGIAYGVQADAYRGNDLYTFSSVTSSPVRPEPAADAVVDVAECAGILHVRFLDSRGRPRPIQGGWMRTVVPRGFDTEMDGGDTEAWLIVRGSDTPITVSLRLQYGSDVFTDLLYEEGTLEAVVPCDQIVEVTYQCRGAGDGGAGLGRIIGEVDLLGVEEIPLANSFFYFANYTSVWAAGGPFGNMRYDALLRTPASGPFELENLMPSEAAVPPQPYTIGATARTGRGRSAGWFSWPKSTETVSADQVLDLGTRYVTDPFRARTGVRLAAAPAPSGREPLLSSVVGTGAGELFVEADGREPPVAGGRFGAPIAYSSAGIDGTLSADATLLSGVAGVHLGGLDGETTRWGAFDVTLVLDSASSEPASHVDQELRIRTTLPDVDAVPGSAMDQDFAACLSEVNLGFRSTSGTFYSPQVTERSAIFDGTDFEGRAVRYRADLEAHGTPISTPAASTGNVRMALPVGDYVLIPRVTAVNPGGGTSSTQLPDVPVKVGCRQVIDMIPEMQVVLAEAPPCTGRAPVRVTGSVRGDLPVALLEHSVNGGPFEITCRDCGTDPTYEFEFLPPPEDLAIAVRSTDTAGGVATTTVHSRFSEEPSALDVRPDAVPLTVRVAGGALDLSWEDVGSPTSVFVGTLASLWDRRAYDHGAAGACAVTSGRATIPAPAGNVYVLAGSPCAWGEGSVGRDSLGRERPPPSPRCE